MVTVAELIEGMKNAEKDYRAVAAANANGPGRREMLKMANYFLIVQEVLTTYGEAKEFFYDDGILFSAADNVGVRVKVVPTIPSVE